MNKEFPKILVLLFDIGDRQSVYYHSKGQDLSLVQAARKIVENWFF